MYLCCAMLQRGGNHPDILPGDEENKKTDGRVSEHHPLYNRFSKGIFGWVGFRTKWIPYENRERSAGKTKWSFWKLLVYSIEGMVAFSTKPLMIASAAGVLFCLVSLILMLFLFSRAALYGDPVAGWPSMVCIVTFLGGIQLFCLGITGIYLSKTYLEVKHRPIYLIKEKNTCTIQCDGI